MRGGSDPNGMVQAIAKRPSVLARLEMGCPCNSSSRWTLQAQDEELNSVTKFH